MKSISDLYNEFKNIFDETNNTLADSAVLYQNRANANGVNFTKEIYYYVLEHCFMRIYLAWENFLEEAFILYLCDSTDMKDNKYKRYATPNDEEHAYELLKGTKQYPDWTNIGDVNLLSKLFFENSGPFKLLLSNPVEFQHMKTIRNRISHTSQKSINKFNTLTNSQIAISGLSAADFLFNYKTENVTFYSFYTDILLSYVEAICNK